MLKAMLYLISLMILVSSCSHVYTSTGFIIPERDILPKAEWSHDINGNYCTNEEGAKNILKTEAMRDGYEAQLKAIIESANNALANRR